MGFCGAFPRGTMMYLKPCLMASFNRSCPFATGRISPDNPTSPNTANCCGSAFDRRLDAQANSTARSEPVSVIFKPPTTLTYTSCPEVCTPP